MTNLNLAPFFESQKQLKKHYVRCDNCGQLRHRSKTTACLIPCDEVRALRERVRELEEAR